MEKTKETTVSTTSKKTEVKTEPRNFLATLLFAVSFGQMGVNRIYTGDTTLGWIRFGLFGGGLLLSPFLIGMPLLLVAQVWGWVDVFLVYHGSRTDVAGVAMTQTERDRKAAKIIYILFVIGLAIGLLSIIVLIILAIVTGISFSNQNGDPHMHDYDSRSYFDRSY
jgi:TM2 domain-containing membrane protein YozV